MVLDQEVWTDPNLEFLFVTAQLVGIFHLVLAEL